MTDVQLSIYEDIHVEDTDSSDIRTILEKAADAIDDDITVEGATISTIRISDTDDDAPHTSYEVSVRMDSFDT